MSLNEERKVAILHLSDETVSAAQASQQQKAGIDEVARLVDRQLEGIDEVVLRLGQVTSQIMELAAIGDQINEKSEELVNHGSGITSTHNRLTGRATALLEGSNSTTADQALAHLHGAYDSAYSAEIPVAGIREAGGAASSFIMAKAEVGRALEQLAHTRTKAERMRNDATAGSEGYQEAGSQATAAAREMRSYTSDL